MPASLAVRAALAAFCLFAAAGTALAGAITIEDAYARAASANARSGAAFLVIRNDGSADDRLIGVASPAAELVQLHTHDEDEAGVMRMRHVPDGFALPAGGGIVMRRGGKHVMFMGLSQSFTQDVLVPLTLVFEEAGEMTIEVPVDLTRKPAMHGSDHDGAE